MLLFLGQIYTHILNSNMLNQDILCITQYYVILFTDKNITRRQQKVTTMCQHSDK